MLGTIMAEFRKLLTVRSTYFIVLISLAIVALFAGFGDGYKASAAYIHSPGLLANESASAIVFIGIILALASLLLMGHEYRYNTIMHTLTAVNHRRKVLFAKFVAITLFALTTALIMTFFAPLCTIIGTHLANKHMAAQHFPAWTVLGHTLFVGWGYVMYAFIIVSIIRSQVGSIVTFLIIPLIGENIIGNIFKSTSKYLPFSSLQAVVHTEMLDSAQDTAQQVASTAHNIIVASCYIAVGLLVSYILFIRRDAN